MTGDTTAPQFHSGMWSAPEEWTNDDKDAFVRMVDILSSYGGPEWLYRGEAKDYPNHLSSLGRILGADGNDSATALNAELQYMEAFWSTINPHLDDASRSLCTTAAGILVLMQHHGAPTRLLDWTQSPWVALYHACSDIAFEKSNGVIWVFARSQLSHKDDPLFASAMHANNPSVYRNCIKGIPPGLYLPRCPARTERMLAQQSVYTFVQPANADHISIMDTNKKGDRGPLQMTIPLKFKPEFMRRLLSMNVTGRTLFPGLDGVGRYVRDCANWKIPILE